MTENNAYASDENTSDEVETRTVFNTEQLKAITSFEDAMTLIEQEFGGEIYTTDMLGDGFTLLDSKNKTQLVGVPFIILSATISQSKEFKNEDGSPAEFASCKIVTKDGRKLILNDGSSGISEQIATLWRMEPRSKGKPLFSARGLRVSEYTHPKWGASKTFYLDTASES